MSWKYSDNPDILMSITGPSGSTIRIYGTVDEYNRRNTREKDTVSEAIKGFMEGEREWLKLQE